MGGVVQGKKKERKKQAEIVTLEFTYLKKQYEAQARNYDDVGGSQHPHGHNLVFPRFDILNRVHDRPQRVYGDRKVYNDGEHVCR